MPCVPCPAKGSASSSTSTAEIGSSNERNPHSPRRLPPAAPVSPRQVTIPTITRRNHKQGIVESRRLSDAVQTFSSLVRELQYVLAHAVCCESRKEVVFSGRLSPAQLGIPLCKLPFWTPVSLRAVRPAAGGMRGVPARGCASQNDDRFNPSTLRCMSRLTGEMRHGLIHGTLSKPPQSALAPSGWKQVFRVLWFFATCFANKTTAGSQGSNQVPPFFFCCGRHVCDFSGAP